MSTRGRDLDTTDAAQARTLFRLFLAAYVAWCVLYIRRTSVMLDGERVFVLWDDAMVSMRYAKNLAAGHGLVWFPGAERVQGYSNLGVTLLMAVIHLFPIASTKTSLVFQVINLGLLIYCALVVRDIARSLFDSEIAALAASVSVMACGPIAILSLQGTDVGFITAIMLAALHAVVAATKDARRWPSHVYAILALGVLARLDFAVVYLSFALTSLAFPRPRGSLWVAAGTFALTAIGILSFQSWYYGHALPNTYYLKATGTPILLMLKSGLQRQCEFLERTAKVLVLTFVSLFAFQRNDRRTWLLGVLPVALFAYDVRAGGDWISEYTSRYFAPALPVLLIAAVGSVWRFLERIALMHEDGATVTRPSGRKRLIAFALCSMVAAFSFNTSRTLRECLNPHMQTMAWRENTENLSLAKYLREHSSRDATLAVHRAGVAPYFLDRYTIDVLGKADAHIARMVVPFFAPGHSKWDWQYIIQERRPDFIDRVSRGLDHRPDFVANYLRTTFDGRELYVRKSALNKLQDPAAKFDPVAP